MGRTKGIEASRLSDRKFIAFVNRKQMGARSAVGLGSLDIFNLPGPGVFLGSYPTWLIYKSGQMGTRGCYLTQIDQNSYLNKRFGFGFGLTVRYILPGLSSVRSSNRGRKWGNIRTKGKRTRSYQAANQPQNPGAVDRVWSARVERMADRISSARRRMADRVWSDMVWI